MKPVELEVTRIGNSRGVRLPAATLERDGVGESVVMQERSDGILLRPSGKAASLLSWEETAREMAAAEEDWSEFDTTLGDGLEAVPWDHRKARKVAGRSREYRSPRRPKK